MSILVCICFMDVDWSGAMGMTTGGYHIWYEHVCVWHRDRKNRNCLHHILSSQCSMVVTKYGPSLGIAGKPWHSRRKFPFPNRERKKRGRDWGVEECVLRHEKKVVLVVAAPLISYLFKPPNVSTQTSKIVWTQQAQIDPMGQWKLTPGQGNKCSLTLKT